MASGIEPQSAKIVHPIFRHSVAGIFPGIHTHGSRRGLRSYGPPDLRFVALFVADYNRMFQQTIFPVIQISDNGSAHFF